MRLCGFSTVTDTIRRAMRLLKFVVQAQNKGGTLYVENEDGSKDKVIFM